MCLLKVEKQKNKTRDIYLRQGLSFRISPQILEIKVKIAKQNITARIMLYLYLYDNNETDRMSELNAAHVL